MAANANRAVSGEPLDWDPGRGGAACGQVDQHSSALPGHQGCPRVAHADGDSSQVGTIQQVFGRPDVRRTCIPSAGGIMNARSEAKFFAMPAQGGGALEWIRPFSEERSRSFSVPHPIAVLLHPTPS